jgi:hypothetical protein
VTRPVSGSTSTSATCVERFALLAADRGDLDQADAAVGAGHGEAAIREPDIGVTGLEHFRRQCRALLHDFFRGARHRRARHEGGARAAVAAADRDQVGITLAQVDLRIGDAEQGRQDLRKGRLVALADMLRTCDQRHAAVALEADVDILLGRAACALDVIGEAQAAQAAQRLALPAAAGEAAEVGMIQCLGQRLGEGPAIDLEAEGVGHRHLGCGHHVAPAQFGPVEAGHPRGRVDQAFEDVDRLGEARAAHHADRRGVGQHHAHFESDRGQAIDRALQVIILIGRHAAADAGKVGADIGDACDL